MLKKNKEVEKETQRAAMKRFVCKLEATDLVRNLTRKLPRKQSSDERTAHERIKIITVMSIFILVSRAPILLACATKVILVSCQYPRAWVSTRHYSNVLFSFLQIRNLVKKKLFVHVSWKFWIIRDKWA